MVCFGWLGCLFVFVCFFAGQLMGCNGMAVLLVFSMEGRQKRGVTPIGRHLF